jgi:putative ABC transport system permease protein
MTALIWLRGLLAQRRGRILATTVGVAVGVALLASIGAFMSSTTSKMTQRAITRVPVDWQVEARNGASASTLLAQVKATRGVERALPVTYGDTSGLRVTSGGSTQTTGPGKVLGIPDGYASAFPGQLRPLAGSTTGVLLAQQTAANLHAKPGDSVVIGIRNGKPATVRVDGVVDLPNADSLFQTVGAPPGAQPKAPPDNVILLPQRLFDSVERGAPVVPQIHTRLSHRLPGSPNAAYTDVTGRANNLETKLAGAGQVGNTIGTELDKARQDALYAQLLFLFLGVPGAIIAGLLTAAIAAAGSERRRQEAALLRTRGASTSRLMRFSLAETAVAGGAGVALGLGAALLIGQSAFGTASFGASTTSAILWAAGATLTGLAIAAASIVLPAWRDARSVTVAGQRRPVGRRDRAPWWARYGLDFLALIGSGLIFWQASKSGYQLVLAPEGVPQVSVNWYALLAPVLGWIGAGLLAYRIVDLVLVRGRTPLARLLSPIAGQLSPIVASTMGRQRRLLARAVTLLALTAAFAGSTAVFNSTYKAQAEVDARLSNGADVTVTTGPGAQPDPAVPGRIAAVPGVKSVEPMMHRFAYVGSDLQDIYGIHPNSMLSAGKLQSAWFQGGTASQLMQKLAQRPDSIILAAETVKDFQLQPGDLVRLRLQDGKTKQYKTVPFHYVGVAKEFPTAPRDSFLVANADYIAKATGSPTFDTFLAQTGGSDPRSVAAAIHTKLGPTALVSNIVDSRRVIGSNLTAVELSGLTRVELGFALALAVAASGLALALGFAERRRTFAIAAALGAKPRQLGAFVWSESALVTTGGVLLGTAITVGIADMLVKVLTGVFDPPPDVVTVPWGYLAALLALTLGAVGAAGAGTLRALRRPPIEELRDL